MTHILDELAGRFGISTSYYGVDGTYYLVPDQTKIAILGALGIRAETEEEAADALAGAPAPQFDKVRAPQAGSCFLPEWLEDTRCWGLAIQLYELRSGRNWGIGDFQDLTALAEVAAAAGADFIGTNPLHALFFAEPNRRSPFSPSNRQFLNVVYVAVDAVPGFAAPMVDGAALKGVRDTDLIDYERVACLKLDALRRLWPVWQALAELPEDYSHAAFEGFRQASSAALRSHALFEALSAQMFERGLGSGWENWPTGYRRPDTPECTEFARLNGDELAFREWLQWLAHVQLRGAQAGMLAAGMRIGLYLDLAVGELPDGSAAWSDPELILRDLEAGAPPDYFSTAGQVWGVSPLSPLRLSAGEEGSYRKLIDTSMHYAGALRIDHAMGLLRMFVVPRGAPPSQGAYLRYPMASMIRAIAEASQDCRVIVVGEDLGNVPEGFRETMQEAAILSYRILYFERSGYGFLFPQEYPARALACLSTHDLPTLEAWWSGEDIGLRLRQGLLDGPTADLQMAARSAERSELIKALVAADALSVPEAALASPGEEANPLLSLDLTAAVHRFMAKSPSRLLAVRLADLGGGTQPENLPGTIDSYPNWRLKLPVAVEDLAGEEVFRTVAAAIAQERPKTG